MSFKNYEKRRGTGLESKENIRFLLNNNLSKIIQNEVSSFLLSTLNS
jgi:hypothetical protein